MSNQAPPLVVQEYGPPPPGNEQPPAVPEPQGTGSNGAGSRKTSGCNPCCGTALPTGVKIVAGFHIGVRNHKYHKNTINKFGLYIGTFI